MFRPIQPPLGLPWLLYGMLGCSLALNLVMVLDVDDPQDACGSDEVARATDTTAAGLPAAGPDTLLPTLEVGEDSTAYAATAQEAATQPAAPPPGAERWTVVDGVVEHSLARTFQAVAGDDGNALAAVYARLFVWDLDLRRDLQKGDRVEVAWRRTDAGVVEIAAARLHSKKYSRTFTAYRWRAPADTFASYWQEEGTEVPYRLVDGPIDDYEQITSLLKDRPTHKGMDFKTPVGTLVKAPSNGTVTRVNWKWTANGNCVEMKLTDGTLAKFLHLSESKVEVGDRVQKGQLIALTGNTGRSTAPHLHYQLDLGRKNIDPVEWHETTRRRLDPSAMDAFQLEVARYDAILGHALATR